VSVCDGGAWVVTRYPDGTEVHAHPNHRPDDEKRAAALGYPDVEAMTLDHDVLHERLARAAGLPYSPTLYGLAHGQPAPPALAALEEAAVLAYARFVNAARSYADGPPV